MNKICTDIEQSKKLIELGIDVNSADIHWQYIEEDNGQLQWFYFPKDFSINENESIPAWSFSALLELIPPYLGEFKDGIDFGLSKAMNSKWYSAHYIQLNNDGMATFNKTVTGDTAIDAAFQMVVWLKENGKI